MNRPFLTLIAFIFLMFPISLLAQEKSFEIVVLPDTQTYMEEYPEIYLNQMQWLADNSERFSFVMHVGDITQNNSKEEWEVAKKGFELLDEKIPYAFALGNHDMGSEAGKFADTRNTSMANKFFATSDIENLVATFPEGSVDNLLSEFKAGGEQWMVLSLEFGPRNKTLVWADKMIAKYPHHNFIVVTHAHLYEDNTHHDGEDWWLPENYGIGKSTGEEAPNNGGQVWKKLLKKHHNVKMVFSGHILKSGVGTLVSEGEQANQVYQMLANYQKGVDGSEKGGNGFLRIIKIFPESGKIQVRTYSPLLNEFKKEKEHQFSFENARFSNTVEQKLTRYKKKQFIKDADTLNYRVLFPKNFTMEKEYPVVLFLHGAGERGNDNQAQLTHGSKLFLANQDEFPAIVIFPQAPKEDYWAKVEVNRDSIPFEFSFMNEKPATKSLQLVMDLMEEMTSKDFVNKDRIYLGGLSMGGMGTFELIYKRPEMFASAFAICGGANPEIAKDYPKGFNIWIFHGKKDDVVIPKYSEAMARAINHYGGNAKLSLYPDDNHNSWDSAFAEPYLLPWLFSHERNKERKKKEFDNP